MGGHAEAARGSDRASTIMKYDGLPGTGVPIVEDFANRRPVEVPVLGSFVSTLGAGSEVSPFSLVSGIGDAVKKPKFTAKITLFDPHSDDNY